LLGQYSEDDVIVVQEAAPKPGCRFSKLGFEWIVVVTTPEIVLVRSGASTAKLQLSELKRVLDLKRAAHQVRIEWKREKFCYLLSPGSGVEAWRLGV